MKAVILAGGQGTRLGKLTTEVPKPMLKLVGKPLMEYHIELLKRYHITDIYITVNYLKAAIVDHFGNGEKFGVNIRYYEETSPLGTVGGIKALEDELRDDFLVIYGDVLVEMDLNKLMAFHKIKKSAATLVLHPNDHPYDSDLVAIDKDEKIIDFIAKPHDHTGIYYRNLVNAGVYILSPKVLSFVEAGKKADFGKDIFPSLVKQLPFYGYNTPEYMKDMGTPDRLVKVEEAIITGKVFRRNLQEKQKAIFLDRDGVINDDTEFIHVADDLKILPGVAEAIQMINKSDYLALVATNQSVIARNLCTEEGLGLIHNKMETDLGKDHAYLDRIYYCPHHPDKGYEGENLAFKIECNCRKPKPGMLIEAAETYHIDLAVSYFVGDHERDIQAGIAAGAISVGVGTGKGLRGSQTKPHYFFMTLQEAVNFIIHPPYTDLANELADIVYSSGQQPYIILIGGNTQSGKSTLAAYLRQSFSEKGISSMKIMLDDWILPHPSRKHPHDVLHNFQSDKLESDIKRILQGGQIDLEGYSPIRGKKPVPETYRYHGEKVVIIEGVAALGIPYLREIADVSFHKTIETEKHFERVIKYFLWKGYAPEEAEALYQQRKTAEYDVVEGWKKFAAREI